MNGGVPALFGSTVFPSGDVSQPWSWWYQFAPVTINQMQTSAPQTEVRVVREVASYGRQLGKIMDALCVLIEITDRDGLDPGQRRSLQELTELADAIAAAKGGLKTPTQTNAMAVMAALRHWKTADPTLFQQVSVELREVLTPTEAAQGGGEEGRGR